MGPSLTPNDTATPEESFYFFLNPMDVTCELPYEVIPGHFLQKPNHGELQRIKEKLQVYHTFYPIDLTTLYETDEGPARLPENKWRYWIVKFRGINSEQMDLQVSCLLLRESLQPDMAFLAHKNFRNAFSWSPASIFQYYGRMMIAPPPLTVTETELDEIRENYRMLKQIQSSWPAVYRSALLFRSLGGSSDLDEMKIIEYFSVIESLITHAPTLTEPMDSLTHQMKTKMNLLDRQFQRRLDYKSIFGTADTDKVWAKLYAYRSKLAHGDEPDFQNELKLLKNRENSMAFLKEAAKLVLLLALREPQFITDLKKC
jgi:hypothetical protein